MPPKKNARALVLSPRGPSLSLCQLRMAMRHQQPPQATFSSLSTVDSRGWTLPYSTTHKVGCL